MLEKRRKRRQGRAIKFVVAFAFVLLITGCGKTMLYHGLSEKDANDILVTLQENGIKASKKEQVVQNETTWAIKVSAKNLAKAQQILVQHNLPRPVAPGLEDICKEKGLIPTPAEEKCRYMLGKKGEIKNALMQNIPEVVDADVILSVPDVEEFPTEGAEKKRPSASIVVKLKPTPDIQQYLNEAKIQRFVANAVEDLDPRDVSVIITYVAGSQPSTFPGETRVLPVMPGTEITPPEKVAEGKSPTVKVAGIEVTKSSGLKLKVYIVIFLIVLMLVSVALIMTIVRSGRLKEQLKSGHPMVEGQVMSEGAQRRLGSGPQT